MRVFWPQDGVARDTGTAVGWRLGDEGGSADTLVVVDVVPEWDDEWEEKSRDVSLDFPIRPLARVMASGLDASSNPDSDTLTIWAEGKLPSAYSQPVETVLFRSPRNRLYYFTLGEDASEVDSGGDTAPADVESPIDARDAALNIQAEYGALCVLGDGADGVQLSCVGMRALLDRLNFVAKAQRRLQGKSLPSQPRIILPISFFALIYVGFQVPILLRSWIGTPTLLCDLGTSTSLPVLGAALNDRSTLVKCWHSVPIILALPAGVYLQAACMGNTSFAGGARAFRTIASQLSRQRVGLKLLPLLPQSSHLSLDQVCGAFIRQISRRASTIAALVETAHTTKLPWVNHVAPAMAINMDIMLGGVASLVLVTIRAAPHLFLQMRDVSARNIADLLTDPVIAALRWLNDWPFGLKLNTGLSAFLCSSTTTALELWRDAATPVLARGLPLFPIALIFVSPFGLSFGVALVSDLLSLLTLHLRLFHFVTAALCGASMTALKGLWDLFRGRRWNVLRHRTDSHAFDVDTLFLGTLLFTVTAFLAPTVLAYGLLFALIYSAICLIQRVLALAVSGINCSVAFQIGSGFMPGGRLPDGIVFDVVPPPHSPQSTSDVEKAGNSKNSSRVYPVHHMLELKSTPIGVGTLVGRWWRETVRSSR